MRTIEVAVELAEQLRDWSEPVRVRFVDVPMPMLELQTAGSLPADFPNDADVEASLMGEYEANDDSWEDEVLYGPPQFIVGERQRIRAALQAVADARRTEERT